MEFILVLSLGMSIISFVAVFRVIKYLPKIHRVLRSIEIMIEDEISEVKEVD